ncbi:MULTISPECIES: YigZ family protein [unclassified Shewanella]|uniref:YigZ family protein n=1 Tax=Shewanella TaxID=22 RepID=UPI000DEBD908|nr:MULTISPECIES: YigZ family protein [unclassified Shewanella]RBP75770.1 putative YigZ family protein [Shewanella putrefaciens]MCU7977537.1 YigZ family protein [Shewanella sp. SW36]MCU7987810.1 YigZ family protein [Shewanella sp. SW24]MCU7992795.1 YigZ family protein [Shewanella sp. SW1]MCU8013611.1 YigZ family protein [Shewanella sp. SM74]
MLESYNVPCDEIVIEEEIKHSRFISFLFHCDSVDKLKLVLTDIKRDYPGASHYCSAFVAGAPDDSVLIGSSDDGEPAGSAGRPMLAVLQGAHIGEVGAVVVRYYGGTKLGVGGLVRAYTSGLRQGLIQLPTQLKQLRYPAKLHCDYAQLRDVEHLLQQVDAVIIDKQFATAVDIVFEIGREQQAWLCESLATLSQGSLRPEFEL